MKTLSISLTSPIYESSSIWTGTYIGDSGGLYIHIIFIFVTQDRVPESYEITTKYQQLQKFYIQHY